MSVSYCCTAFFFSVMDQCSHCHVYEVSRAVCYGMLQCVIVYVWHDSCKYVPRLNSMQCMSVSSCCTTLFFFFSHGPSFTGHVHEVPRAVGCKKIQCVIVYLWHDSCTVTHSYAVHVCLVLLYYVLLFFSHGPSFTCPVYEVPRAVIAVYNSVLLYFCDTIQIYMYQNSCTWICMSVSYCCTTFFFFFSHGQSSTCTRNLRLPRTAQASLPSSTARFPRAHANILCVYIYMHIYIYIYVYIYMYICI